MSEKKDKDQENTESTTVLAQEILILNRAISKAHKDRMGTAPLEYEVGDEDDGYPD